MFDFCRNLINNIFLISAIYEVYVEDFMITEIKHIYLGMNYINLRDLLIQNKKITVFPLVDNQQTMTLLGSIPRNELIQLLDQQMGAAKRRLVLPSPRVLRPEEEEEPVEIIPIRKKSHMPIIDDSSDSEKEDDSASGSNKNEKTDEIKLENRDQQTLKETSQVQVSSEINKFFSVIFQHSSKLINFYKKEMREDIFKRWDTGRRKPPPLHIPKSPLPERRSPGLLGVVSIFQ